MIWLCILFHLNEALHAMETIWVSFSSSSYSVALYHFGGLLQYCQYPASASSMLRSLLRWLEAQENQPQAMLNETMPHPSWPCSLEMALAFLYEMISKAYFAQGLLEAKHQAFQRPIGSNLSWLLHFYFLKYEKCFTKHWNDNSKPQILKACLFVFSKWK